MTIKLSEKGKLKVAMADVRVVMLPTDPPKYRASKEADALEFDTDDFKNVVVLTAEEAKDILHSLNCNWSRCPVKAECKDLIKKKIKEVESK